MTSAEALTVVVSASSSQRLSDCLEGLAAQTASGFRIVVVGAQVPDAAIDCVRAGLSRPADLNAGLRAVRTPLVLLLDGNMIPDRDLVERHAGRHANSPGIAVVGRTDWHGDQGRDPMLRWLVRRGGLAEHRVIPATSSPLEGASLPTSNVSVAASLVDDVGGFDETLLFGHEGTDMGLRLAGRGVELVVEPEAVASQAAVGQARPLDAVLELASAERQMVAKHSDFSPPMAQRMEANRDGAVGRGWRRTARALRRPAPLARWLEAHADRTYEREFAARYLEQYARAEAVVELASYLGDDYRPEALVRAGEEVDAEARASDDETTFYRTSQTYLYDLTVFEMSPTKEPYRAVLKELVPAPARVLDYGCGIGSDGLRLLGEGYQVGFADFANPSTEYLDWRLRRRGLQASIFDIEADALPRDFDVAFSFDVIEHVPDPFAFLEQLETRASIVLVNLLEEDEHDHEHDHVHHELPIERIVEHARGRGLLHQSLHYGRSHLIAYRGRLD